MRAISQHKGERNTRKNGKLSSIRDQDFFYSATHRTFIEPLLGTVKDKIIKIVTIIIIIIINTLCHSFILSLFEYLCISSSHEALLLATNSRWIRYGASSKNTQSRDSYPKMVNHFVLISVQKEREGMWWRGETLAVAVMFCFFIKPT